MSTIKTKVLSINLKEREKTAKAIDSAVAVLNAGGVVALPSETCYTLAVDATNEAAVQRLFTQLGVKAGPSTNIVVPDLRMAAECVKLNQPAEKLVHSFMPGPLTLLMHRIPGKLAESLCFDDSIAFRISSSTLARLTAQELGKPITIANISPEGESPVYTTRELQEKLTCKVELIIETGNLLPTLLSTILDLRSGKPVLVRQGPIKLEEVEMAIRQ